MATIKQKVVPFLWYDGKAEEAMNLYTTVFPNSKIISIKKWGEGSPFGKDNVMTGIFDLDGTRFYCFDAGPEFKFTEAVSFFVNCDTQEEIDHYWNKLTEMADRKACVAGLRINSVYPGRSYHRNNWT